MTNVWRKTVPAHVAICLDIVISLVQTEMLLMLGRWNRPKYIQIVQGLWNKNHVMDICACDCHCQRNAVCVSQETSLDAFFPCR